MQAEKDEQDGGVLIDGVLMFKRPDGKWETNDERDKRLAHNARMRYNRSFESTLE